MIDLNEAQQTRSLLKEWCEQGMVCISTPVKHGQLLDLMNRLVSAEKDAARYRWLRDEARHHMDGGPLVFMANYDGDPVAYQDCGMVLHDSYLDSAIDEAMSVNQA